MPDSRPRKGLIESLTTFATTLVAVVQTRLELLSTDLEEEREHLFALLAWSLAALFCLGMAVMLTTLLVVAVFWDTYRLTVLGLLAGTFLAAALAAWLRARYTRHTKPRLFAASLAEIDRDHRALRQP
jgi:uncharacterized membrane protein YqjE